MVNRLYLMFKILAFQVVGRQLSGPALECLQLTGSAE